MSIRDESLAVAFGEALRQVRVAKGLRMLPLSHLAGLAGNYVSVLERGMKTPSLAVLLALAESLGITPQELLALTLVKLGRNAP